jgi:hypothetical protein
VLPVVGPGALGEASNHGHGFSLFPGLAQPRSIGRMCLRSADPTAKPALKGPRRLWSNEYAAADAVQTDDEIRAYVRAYATRCSTRSGPALASTGWRSSTPSSASEGSKA